MDRPIAYLRWHERVAGDADHDLATSDQHAVAATPADDATDGGSADGVVPPALAGREAPADADLRSQLAAVYGVDREAVLLTPGATGANLLAAAAATAGGGDVLVEQPGYEPLVATPEWLGAGVDRYERPLAAGAPLDADRVAAAAGPETALVTASNRHNPSGRRVGRETLAAAAEAAADADARLLVDEVYAPFGDAAGDGPFGGPTAAGLEGTVVTGSLTKFFGLGGLRVGWLVADPEFVADAHLAAHHVGRPPEPSRALARRALANREAIGAAAREQCRANADLLASFVAGRDDLRGPVHDGATYAALAHERADGDAVAEAAREEGLVVVPGRFFDSPGRVRVSLGGDPETMAAALSAFGRALDRL